MLYKIITEKANEIERKEQEHMKFAQRKNHHYACSPINKKKTLKVIDEHANNNLSLKSKKTIKFRRVSNPSTPSRRSQLGSA